MMTNSQLSRRSLLAGAMASAHLGSGEPQAQRNQPSEKPNVIVILFDDLGVHDLGYLGATDLKTPNIDQLAASGTVCRNWYSNAPVCAPARSALMTGRFPLRAGVGRNGLPLRASERTIAAILKEYGYATALTGKWHLGSTPETVPNAHGFDYFYGFHEGCVDYFSQRFYWGEPKLVNFHDLWRNREEIFDDGEYLTNRIAQEACEFINKQRGNPFFLYTAFNAVHYPMHAPRRYVERFPTLEPERQMYAAMLSAADDGVGEIIHSLEQIGQRDNTLIFLLGDNGATRERRAGLNQQPATAGKNLPFRGFKFSTFDGGMHVPGLVNWPGRVPKGTFVDQVVMTADILPTVCHLTGAQAPSDRTIDGRNIWPALTAGEASPHEYMCWSEGPQLAIRRGKWKLVLRGVVHDGSPMGERPLEGDDAVFLSNLDEDPGEHTNLRHRYPDITDQLQSLAHQWRESVESN
jgi:arylsulfatase A-like enzyme